MHCYVRPFLGLATLAGLAGLALAGAPYAAVPVPFPGHDQQHDLAASPFEALLGRADASSSFAVTNLQSFQGSVGGVSAPAISQSSDKNRPFQVDGDTFTDFLSAADRACDNQHNSCADAVNSNKVSGVSVSDCDAQNTKCKSAASSATATAFTQLTTSTSELDIFCEI